MRHMTLNQEMRLKYPLAYRLLLRYSLLYSTSNIEITPVT